MKKLILLITIFLSVILISSCIEKDLGPLLSHDENGLLIVDNNKYKKIEMYSRLSSVKHDTIFRLKEDNEINVGYYWGAMGKKRKTKIGVYYNALDLEKNFLWDYDFNNYVKIGYEIPEIDDLVITRIEVNPVQFNRSISNNYSSTDPKKQLFYQYEEISFDAKENRTLSQMMIFGMSSKPDNFYNHIFEICFDFYDYPYLECTAFNLVVHTDSIYIQDTWNNLDYEIDEKYKDYFIDLVNRYIFDNYIN